MNTILLILDFFTNIQASFQFSTFSLFLVLLRRTFYFGPSRPPKKEVKIKEKSSAGGVVQKMARTNGGRGGGHFFQQPAFSLFSALFFRSFSPTFALQEGDKKKAESGPISRGRGRIFGQNECENGHLGHAFAAQMESVQQPHASDRLRALTTWLGDGFV